MNRIIFVIFFLFGLAGISTAKDSICNTWKVESSKIFKYNTGYIIQSRIKRENETVIIRLKGEDIKRGNSLEDYENKDIILTESCADFLPERPILSVMGEFDLLRDRFTIIGQDVLVKNCQIIGVKKAND